MLALVAALLAQDSPQVAVVRALDKLHQDKAWAKIYADHTHPHLRKQLSAEQFSAFMNGEKGKPIVELFREVVKAVDGKAGPDILLARASDEEDEYEFVLVKVQADPARKGRQWHVELKLDAGAWKLKDTD